MNIHFYGHGKWFYKIFRCANKEELAVFFFLMALGIKLRVVYPLSYISACFIFYFETGPQWDTQVDLKLNPPASYPHVAGITGVHHMPRKHSLLNFYVAKLILPKVIDWFPVDSPPCVHGTQTSHFSTVTPLPTNVVSRKPIVPVLRKWHDD